MIVSAINGRMRMVDPRLKKQATANTLETRLHTIAGVESIHVNQITGSLLVIYDNSIAQARVIRDVVKKQLKAARSNANAKPLNGKQARKAVKMGMLGTIIGSMGILMAGSEKWHYRIGVGFISLLSLHLYQNQKRIFK